jgi:hypothetical protein
MARGSAPSIHALLAVCAAVGATITAAKPASAEEAPELIHIDYTAPPGCPNASAFERELKSRTRRAWTPAGRVSARALTVSITSDKGLYRGRFLLEDPAGSSQSDEVPWEGCDDIVAALAVKAAIAIDGSPPSLMPTVGPRFPTWKSEPWVFRPSPFVLGDRPQPWRLTVGANLSAIGALSPFLTPAASVHIDMSKSGEGLGAMTIRISILRAIEDIDVNDDIVTMQWIASRLEVCPLKRLIPPISVSPCMAVDTGAIEWKLSPPGAARHWIALDLIGRAQLALFERLILEFQAGVIVPLTRNEFGLGAGRISGKSVHRVPVISGTFGGGTGVRFP